MIDYFKFKVENFEHHKQNLINLISKIPTNPLLMQPDKSTISHTDYDLPPKMKREYVVYFIEHIFKEYTKFICQKLGCKKIQLSNVWFQIYGQGDSHDYHVHPGCNLTNVFFLSLPNKNIQTKIRLPNKDYLKNDVSEGDIICFPAYYYHCSPLNENKENKIIIAFNTNVSE